MPDPNPWTLERVEREIPELAPLARLHLAVEDALRAFERDHGHVHPELRGVPGAHWMQGTPLIDAADRATIVGRLPALVRAVAEAVSGSTPSVRGAVESAVASAGSFHWQGALTSFRDASWTPGVREPHVFRFLLLRAISVPARHLARAYSAPHPDRWKRSNCPFCGIEGVASIARTGAGRTLVCVLCGGRWEAAETVCGGCGERNLASFRVLAAREAGPATIESCGKCGTAVKVFSPGDVPWGPPIAVEVASVRLDLLAERDERTFRDSVALAVLFPPA
jgi:transcription elongation factor Elf1